MKTFPLILGQEYFLTENVLEIANDLLGKVLISQIDNVTTGGIIVETEAYRAPDDRACHAYGNKYSSRTKTMFDAGGVAYIYLCYGIHHLFNVVTAPQGTAHAVLIRALIPLIGIDEMVQRRSLTHVDYRITKGPGSLSSALGIKTELNHIRLYHEDSPIQIWDYGLRYKKAEICTSKRIGVQYAGDSATLPWRYFLRDCPYVSKHE